MKKIEVISVIFCALAFVMCSKTTMPEAAKRPPVSPSELGYEPDMAPLFYYTEGIKKMHIERSVLEAARLFDRAIETDSLFAPAYYSAGMNIALFDLTLALDYSRRAASLDSTNIWYKAQLGRLLVFGGEYDEALDIYRDLTRISPRDPENFRMLAALYEVNEMPFAALAVLDSAEYRLGKIEELSSFRRELLMKVKLYDTAISEAKEMVENYPYNYQNYLVLAELHSIKGEDSLAIDNFQKALSLNPDGTDIIVAMNEYYKMKGDDTNFLRTARQLFMSDELPVESKIQFYEDITSNRDYYGQNFYQISDLASTLVLKYPQDYRVIRLYGSNMIAFGNIEDALKIYKNYISDTTSIIEPFNEILDIEAYLGRNDSLQKYTALALQRFPDSPDLYMRNGYAQLYMENHGEALKQFEKALKHTTSDSLRAQIYGSIGDIYHQEGNSRKSYSYYNKALKLDPDNILALNNYAYFLSLEDKELDKALTMSEKVVTRLAPGNPTYLDTYGWVLYKLGRYEEAKKVLQQAVSLDRHASKELFVHYGDILFKLEDYFMATVYWRKALEAGYDEAEINTRLESIPK